MKKPSLKTDALKERGLGLTPTCVRLPGPLAGRVFFSVGRVSDPVGKDEENLIEPILVLRLEMLFLCRWWKSKLIDLWQPTCPRR